MVSTISSTDPVSISRGDGSTLSISSTGDISFTEELSIDTYTGNWINDSLDNSNVT